MFVSSSRTTLLTSVGSIKTIFKQCKLEVADEIQENLNFARFRPNSLVYLFFRVV